MLKDFWRNHSLSTVMFGLFVLFLAGQAITGYQVQTEDARTHGQAVESFVSYLSSGHFGEAVFENWESEFLQMAAYVFLTVFLFQKGSAESKDPGKYEVVDEDPAKKRRNKQAPWPVKRGGWVLRLYQNSLGLALVLLFAGSFVMHGVEGARSHCDEDREHSQPCESVAGYMTSSQFWFESFQNWQSEFLSVAVLVVFSIYLRQQGSPESKPVAAPNDETGEG